MIAGVFEPVDVDVDDVDAEDEEDEEVPAEEGGWAELLDIFAFLVPRGIFECR